MLWHEWARRLVEDIDVLVTPVQSFFACVPIRPEAHQSFAFTKSGHRYQPKRKVAYVNRIVEMLLEQSPEEMITGPVRLTVVFCHAFRKKDVRALDAGQEMMLAEGKRDGDLTNLVKPFEDALRGVFFRDDGIVVAQRTVKIRMERAFIGVLVEEVKLT